MKTYSRKRTGDNTPVIINLNELCRLCLSKEDELIPIFNEEDPVPLTLRIMACVSLEVFEGDGLPNMICHACKFQLEKSYTFKKKCESSDLRLRRHLKLIQEKTPESNASNTSKQDVSQLLADLMSGNDVTESGGPGTEPDSQSADDNGSTIVELPNSEQELVGARVTYLQSDHDQGDETANSPDDITLPPDDNLTKDTCIVKRELDHITTTGIYLLDDNDAQDSSYNEIERTDYGAIAEAVKQTLASQPGINISGALQIKVENSSQVQVTTEDGSVIVMELLTEEESGGETEVDTVLQSNTATVVETTIASSSPSPPPPPPPLPVPQPLLPPSSSLQTQPTSTKATVTTNTQVIAPRTLEQDDNDEFKVFACPDCPKSFSRRIQLRRHASVHMQQRGFSCGLCEKWSPTRSALIRHERIHTGERPFKCDVCHKCFAQKEILYRHLMTHTGDKPYKCTHCPKGFTQRESLRVHMRSHSARPGPQDIQLHKCSLCPKVFCHASGLSRHLVAHTGRTFKCRDCDKAFSDKSSLRRHHRFNNHQP